MEYREQSGSQFLVDIPKRLRKRIQESFTFNFGDSEILGINRLNRPVELCSLDGLRISYLVAQIWEPIVLSKSDMVNWQFSRSVLEGKACCKPSKRIDNSNPSKTKFNTFPLPKNTKVDTVPGGNTQFSSYSKSIFFPSRTAALSGSLGRTNESAECQRGDSQHGLLANTSGCLWCGEIVMILASSYIYIYGKDLATKVTCRLPRLILF